MDRRELGRWAEDLVARNLARSGYAVLARNVRLQRGEIDLVARQGERLWFVEVKCRSRSDVGPPHRAVDSRKRAALYAAGREFVSRSAFRGDWGFLVASVVGAPGGAGARVELGRLSIAPRESGGS